MQRKTNIFEQSSAMYLRHEVLFSSKAALYLRAMSPIRATLLALILAVLFYACTHAPAAPVVRNSPADAFSSAPPSTFYPAPGALDTSFRAFLEEYNRFFEQEMSRTQTPGAAVVVVKDSQIVFLRGYGVRNWGGRDSVNANTVFRVASLSKGFTGVLTGMLVQSGAFQWEDLVQKYYPAFTLRDRQQAGRICLWHLLSQTTGLPYHAYTNLIERNFSIPRIVEEYFPKAPICGKEGEFYSYQNAAFCVIEEVMRTATGKTYPQLLTEKILQPAGMRSASCDFETMRREPNKALPQVWTGYGWRADSISRFYYNSAAAGGVNASAADMGEWLKLLLGHRPDLVSDATLDRVFSPVVKTDKERRIFPRWLGRSDASYAMGWRVLTHEGDTIVYHGGYVNGFKSEIALNRRTGLGICVLFNAHTELSKECVPKFFEYQPAEPGRTSRK